MSSAANATFARTLFGLLARGGVRHVVVSPGARSAPLALAADVTPGLATHVLVDERVAAFFALGLARASGEAVVFLCTSGSAGAHALPAVIEARLSGVPLIVLTADRPAELQDCGALQTVEQTRLFGDAAASFALDAPGLTQDFSPLRTRVAQILDRARFPVAGPVHVNVPLREPLVGEPAAALHIEPLTVLRDVQRPSPRQLDSLHPLFDGARGVIVCGPLSPDDHVGASVHALAEALGWPVVAEPTSQACFGYERPTLISAGAAILRQAARAFDPEVVLRLGQTPTSRGVGEWLAKQSGRTVLVDPAGRVHDPYHAASHLVVTDATALCDALTRAELAPAPAGWLRLWQHAEQLGRRILDDAAASGFWEGAVARLAVRSGYDLHLGNSLPIRDVELFGGRLAERRRVFANRGASGIDGTLASALGEAVANGRRLCAILGDLSLAHDVGGLLAARLTGGQLTTLVVDNGGGGIFRTLPFADQSPSFARYCLTPMPLEVESLCQAAGFSYTPVDSTDALAAALTHSAGLQLVHARVDGAASQALRARALAAVDRAMTHFTDTHETGVGSTLDSAKEVQHV